MSELAVLIPVYNNQAGLDRSLGSLKLASGCFDVFVVDDGSGDVVLVPARLRNDVRVFLLRLEENQGIAAALNYGLRNILARGYSYIARLDAGDTILRQRFEQQTEYLDLRPTCGVIGSFIEFVDTTQEHLYCYRAPCEHHEILESLHLNNCIVHSGSMMRTDALRAVGFYREDFPGAEDYELFLRIATRYTLAVIPEMLTRCEYNLEGLSIAGRRSQQRSRLRLQLRYFDPASAASYYGLLRTLIAMLAPHTLVLRVKTVLANGNIRRKPQPEPAPE